MKHKKTDIHSKKNIKRPFFAKIQAVQTDKQCYYNSESHKNESFFKKKNKKICKFQQFALNLQRTLVSTMVFLRGFTYSAGYIARCFAGFRLAETGGGECEYRERNYLVNIIDHLNL